MVGCFLTWKGTFWMYIRTHTVWSISLILTFMLFCKVSFHVQSEISVLIDTEFLFFPVLLWPVVGLILEPRPVARRLWHAVCYVWLVSKFTFVILIHQRWCCESSSFSKRSLRYNSVARGCMKLGGIYYLLTPWGTVLEKLTGFQLVKKFPHFMEPKGSLPHSQVPATCPYSEPAVSSPYPHIPLPEDPS